jgi:hypothetical protein
MNKVLNVKTELFIALFIPLRLPIISSLTLIINNDITQLK